MANKKMVYDLVVIGSGPGGYVAAIRGAQLGGKIAVVEKGELGGTCLNRGCIPTKALFSSLQVLSTIQKAGEFGIKTQGAAIDLAVLRQRKDRIVSRLINGIGGLFKSYGIELIKGAGKIVSPTRVQVGNSRQRAAGSGQPLVVNGQRIIIATGSVPAQLPGIEPDGENILTSDEALELNNIPSSLLVIGGGVIGVELACIFNQLGSRVAIVELLSQIIPTQDEEVSKQLKEFLLKQGIRIKNNAKVMEVKKRNNLNEVRITKSQGEELLSVEKILLATGRKPYTEGLGLEEVGIKVENGSIVVNNRMETNVPGTYAIGDVIGGDLLAQVASAEGIVAAENALGRESEIDYKAVPTCIFTSPEVASVGLTEQKARALRSEIGVGKFPFRASGRAMTMGETQGMVKMITDKKTDEILGVHIIGPAATELIAEASLAIKLEATTAELNRIIHPHPTLSEAIFGAAGAVHNEAIDLPKPRINTNSH